MRITSRQSVLVLLVSLFATDYRSTAFIPNARRQVLSRSTDNNEAMDGNGDKIISTRLFASSSSENNNKNNRLSQTNRNDKRTTELRAATGISLPSTPTAPSTAAAYSPSSDERSGVGVLFLNLGGPTTGDDVEGTLFSSTSSGISTFIEIK